MKKVILFARVSTGSQDTERQKDLLTPLILEDGFTEDDIAVIDEAESAIKNDYDNRTSLQKLEDLIQSDPIEAVYITELSRLGRRNDVLYKVLGILSEKKIALVIQSPQLIRTYEKKDGVYKPNYSAIMFIAYCQQQAVSEMDLKASRTKSGRETRKIAGHITTSKVKFGYQRSVGDKESRNRPLIKEDDANIVREIFRLYLEGNSCGIIYNKFYRIAGWTNSTPHSQDNRVYRILIDPTYIGKNEHYPYPPIIDEETFNKVQELTKNRNLIKYKTNFVYYCHKLIKWGDRTFTPSFHSHRYTLLMDDGKNYGLNIDCMDGLTKHLSFIAYAITAEENSKKQKEHFAQVKEIAQEEIESIKKEIDEIEPQLERLTNVYVMGRKSESAYNKEYAALEKQRDNLYKQIDDRNVTILAADNILSKETVSATTLHLNIDEITDDNQIVEIINETIDSINVEKIDNGWIIRYTYKDIVYNKQHKDEYFKYIKKNNKIINLYACNDGSDFIEDWTGCWEKRLLNHFKTNKKGGSN